MLFVMRFNEEFLGYIMIKPFTWFLGHLTYDHHNVLHIKLNYFLIQSR